MTTSQEKQFDFAVVGRGLMGTACASHLARAGARVLLIGPDEPQDRSTHDGPFASHHDAGRITRAIAENADWSRLAIRSIERYAELETVLGQRFYHPCGILMAGPQSGPSADFTRGFLNSADRLNIPIQTLDDTALKARFPFFNFPQDTCGGWENLGGWINPRLYRHALEKMACLHGAHVSTETVSARDGTTLTTRSGQTLKAEHIVLATGAYARTDTLLQKTPDMGAYARTVVLAEVDEKTARDLETMPSVITMPENRRMDEDLYLLPPIRYPDGKLYIKIGGEPVSSSLTSDAEMTRWFKSKGSQDAVEDIKQHLYRLLPNVPFISLTTDTCVISFTKTKLPFIERLNDGLTILTGGNGASAKSCDEIGRLGAMTAMGKSLENEGYDADFRAAFQ